MTFARRIASRILVLAFALSAARVAIAQPRTERVDVDPLTATISGRVTSETGGPLRRAEIRATSNGGLSRFATTDTEGRYVVRDLPAGTFTLHVSKSGFVPLYFGQRRPFERRSTIALVPGQRVNADIRLPRAGAITGHIVDRMGEPVMGARVQALRRRMVNGQRGLQAAGAADTTDDTGAYRVYGLPPGDYYVTATPRGVEDRAGRALPTALGRNTPIFYPGTASRDEAQRVAVDVAGEARADLVLTEVRTSRVSGIVLTSNGTPANGAMVSLLSRDLSFGGNDVVGEALVPLQIQDDADVNGRFTLEGVPPGSFTLRVNTRPTISIADLDTRRVTARSVLPSIETAMLPVNVDGDNSGLTVTTSPGGTVDVVLVADQGVTAQLPDNVRFTARTSDGNSLSLMAMDHVGTSISAGSISVTPDRSSAEKATLLLQGPARLSVDGLPDNWALKALLLDNENVTDRPVELRDGQPRTLRVVLTDRVTNVVGSVASPPLTENASAQAIVLVFADDERKWTYPSRFIRSVRADRGRFDLAGLPPEEYRVVAIDYLEDGEEYDPDFLKRMRERSVRFSLREGQQTAIDLRLIQR